AVGCSVVHACIPILLEQDSGLSRSRLIGPRIRPMIQSVDALERTRRQLERAAFFRRAFSHLAAEVHKTKPCRHRSPFRPALAYLQFLRTESVITARRALSEIHETRLP